MFKITLHQSQFWIKTVCVLFSYLLISNCGNTAFSPHGLCQLNMGSLIDVYKFTTVLGMLICSKLYWHYSFEQGSNKHWVGFISCLNNIQLVYLLLTIDYFLSCFNSNFGVSWTIFFNLCLFFNIFLSE